MPEAAAAVTIPAMSPRQKMILVLILEGLGLAALGVLFAFVLMNASGQGLPALFLAANTFAPSATAPPPAASATATAPRPTATRLPPTATFSPEPSATMTLTPTVTGHVTETGSGLRLREEPGTAGAILELAQVRSTR